MRATLILHAPPAANEAPTKATAKAHRLAERIGKLLGADQTVVRSGAGWNFEVTYSSTEPLSLED